MSELQLDMRGEIHVFGSTAHITAVEVKSGAQMKEGVKQLLKRLAIMSLATKHLYAEYHLAIEQFYCVGELLIPVHPESRLNLSPDDLASYMDEIGFNQEAKKFLNTAYIRAG